MAVAESPCLLRGTGEEGHSPDQEPQGRRVEASHLVALVHGLERDRGDQDPRPERHDGRSGAPLDAGVDIPERPTRSDVPPTNPQDPALLYSTTSRW